MLVDTRGLIILLIDFALLLVVVLRSWSRNYDDSDQGGGSIVMLRPPLRPSYRRCTLFLALSFGTSILLAGMAYPNAKGIYHNWVQQMMSLAIRDPSVVDRFATQIIPIVPVTVIGFGLAFAISFHASLARRIVILLNVAIFLAVSVVSDALLGVFVLSTGLSLAPTPIMSMLIQYFLAGLVAIRLALTTFQLPKKTPIPLLRRGYWRDSALMGIAILAALACAVGLIVVLNRWIGASPITTAIVAYSTVPYLTTLIFVFLGLVRMVAGKRPHPGPERPPIEIIIPAYNEEICIGDLLESLDRAATVYGGPVRVILCDDGSTDATREIATQTMDAFRSASGEIIEGRHAGKSAALNAALALCEADIVYRVDADCTVHEECFLYSVPHFLADPRVGLVGALTLPKEPYTTWIDRMRMFEMVVGFGFRRPCFDVVDGIICIPGTFTAFRRLPALEIGGFVDGMYGEDVDFTMAIARLGYRAIVDTRVRSFEDVPNTQRQLRIQRTRWHRGGAMGWSRHVMFFTGWGTGPRTWFFYLRSSESRFLAPLNMTTFCFLVTTAIFHPSPGVNTARLLFLLVFHSAPALLLIPVCVIYYRKGHHLYYLPLQYVFALLKHYYKLEAFLSFNARPVLTSTMAQALRLRRPAGPRGAHAAGAPGTAGAVEAR